MRFMLASNIFLLVRVLVADSPGNVFGYARLRLGQVGEGNFQVTGEIKETEFVSIQDQLLGYITITFKVKDTYVRTCPRVLNNGQCAAISQPATTAATHERQAARSISSDTISA